jgi:hypothetical protein
MEGILALFFIFVGTIAVLDMYNRREEKTKWDDF